MLRFGLFFLALPTVGHADVTARFLEGAPKDRFIIENTGDCGLSAGQITIDLAPSAAGLIFDTSSSGAGVEVFQPLEVTTGAALLTNAPTARDGDTQVTLTFAGLAPKDQIAFTIDVDDTRAQSDSGQIIVRGGEIEGAIISDGQATAEFSNQAIAILPTRCSG